MHVLIEMQVMIQKLWGKPFTNKALLSLMHVVKLLQTWLIDGSHDLRLSRRSAPPKCFVKFYHVSLVRLQNKAVDLQG